MTTPAQIIKGDGFTHEVFARLGRTPNEAHAISSVAHIVDPLLTKINRSMWASRFSALRSEFGLNGGDAFLTSGNYLHGSPGHWYVFHKGGPWEPQFNIGMFGTRPGGPAYLRIGIGLNLTMASADPDRESGQRLARTLFGNLSWLARSPKKSLIAAALSVGRPLAECVGAPADESGQSERVIRWLGGLPADDVLWALVGRRISTDVAEDAELLADRGDLGFEITRTFDAWLPVWEATMRGME